MSHKQNISKRELEMYFTLYKSGALLDTAVLIQLKQGGYDVNYEVVGAMPETRLSTNLPAVSQSQITVDPFVSTVSKTLQIGDYTAKATVTKSQLASKISQSFWMPQGVGIKGYMDPEIIQFIDTMLFGDFRDIYIPHYLSNYITQAYYWLNDDPLVWSSDLSYEQANELLRTEAKRCKCNSLYALNKHLWFQESGATNGLGKEKYTAWPLQQLVLFLQDCGYSLFTVKGRQVGLTITEGGWVANKTMVCENYKAKYIACDLLKSMEIYTDKIYYSYSNWSEYMRPSVFSDTTKSLRVGYKEEKGTIKGNNSSILVASPSKYSINGGTPSVVLLDEIGMTEKLGSMMKEGRPTLFKNINGTLRMVRQVVGWGTGGNINREGKDLEIIYMGLVREWQERTFDSGIIPMFIQCFAKPGITEEFLESEYRSYMAGTKEGLVLDEDPEVQYKQHYPKKIADVFLSSDSTLIPRKQIDVHVKRALEAPKKYGYFIPKYSSSPNAPIFLRNKGIIVGAEFIQTDRVDPLVTTTIFHEPDPAWINRYYKGTDCIDHSTGTSNFSSTIWDCVSNNFAAEVAFRVPDYHECYEQSICLSFYFANKRGDLPFELIETNTGSEFASWIAAMGLEQYIISNAELPDMFQSSEQASQEGISKKAHNAPRIVGKLIELITVYGEKIDSPEFWSELSSFTKQLNPSKTGYVWRPKDKAYYKDDRLDSGVYGYLAAESKNHLVPKNVDVKTEKDWLRESKPSRNIIRGDDGRLTVVVKSAREAKIENALRGYRQPKYSK